MTSKGSFTPSTKALLSVILLFLLLPIASASASSTRTHKATTFVGGDLHTLTYTSDGLFVTGHLSGSVSKDEGTTWKSVTSFKNADIMGWATTDVGYLAGGHNGLFRLSKVDKSFSRVTFFGKVSDVHSLGAAGKNVYMGSPEAGFLRSTNSGKTWKVVNKKFGQGFMGSMLIDTKNPLKVIAPDMNYGLVVTLDGGKTWSRMGGPTSVMSVAWNPINHREIVALGMGSGLRTTDSGKTWKTFPVPAGAAAFALSPTGKKIFVAVLNNEHAGVLSSVDEGMNWK